MRHTKHARSIQTLTVISFIGWSLLCGCAGREYSETQRYLPDAYAPIEAYGLVLDTDATPEEVVWVLFQAIKQDVQAGKDYQTREEAIKLQCRLAHREMIAYLVTRFPRPGYTQQELIADRIEHWGPLVSYYAEYFEDNLEQARKRMQVQPAPKQLASTSKIDDPVATVSYTLPSAQYGGPDGLVYGVEIRVLLAKRPPGYWRICGIEFGPSPDLKHGS